MDKHKHIQSKIKTVNAEVKIFIEGSMFWKKMHTMQKRMTWEETAYCHPQKPQATGRVTSSYSSSNWLLLKTGKGIPKSRKETPCLSPTALSSIAYWYGGNWIFPLPPRATNWNCSANLCPRKEAKTSNLLRNQPQQWTPKHLDSHRRESKGTQQLLKPSCQTNSMNWERGCSCLSQHSCCALTSPCRKQTAPGTRGPDELGCPGEPGVPRWFLGAPGAPSCHCSMLGAAGQRCLPGQSSPLPGCQGLSYTGSGHRSTWAGNTSRGAGLSQPAQTSSCTARALPGLPSSQRCHGKSAALPGRRCPHRECPCTFILRVERRSSAPPEWTLDFCIKSLHY